MVLPSIFGRKDSGVKKIIPFKDVIGCEYIGDQENPNIFAIKYTDGGSEQTDEYEAKTEREAVDIANRIKYLMVRIYCFLWFED